MDESDHDYTLAEAIELACLRPHMFTGEARVESIANLINGFVWGKGRVAKEQIDGFHGWLQIWLAETGYPKSEIPSNYAWQWYLKEAFPNDEDAIRNLPLLFKEFLHHSQKAQPGV